MPAIEMKTSILRKRKAVSNFLERLCGGTFSVPDFSFRRMSKAPFKRYNFLFLLAGVKMGFILVKFY